MKSKLGTWSLILGIISIPCICTFLGVIPAAIGLILGIIAIKRGEGGSAIAGVIISLVGFICGAIVLGIASNGIIKELRMDNYISSAEYDKAEKMLEDDSFSDSDTVNWYYKLYSAQGKYDEAAEKILEYADTYEKIDEFPEYLIEHLDELYDSTSKDMQTKIDDLKQRKADALAAVEAEKAAAEEAKRAEEEAKKQAEKEAQEKAAAEEKEKKKKQEEEQKKQQEAAKKEQEKAIQTAIKQRLAEEITRSEYEDLVKDYDEELIYEQIVRYMQKTFKKDTFDLSQAYDLKDCIELYNVSDEKKDKEHEQFLNSVSGKCDEYLEPAEFVLYNVAYIDRLNRGDYYPIELYLQRKIDSGLSDMFKGKMYYYANNYIYNDWGGDWGDEEYIIVTDEAFADSGYIYLWLYDTGETMTIKTSTGFERAVPIYEYRTTEQIEQLQNDYEQAETQCSKLAGELIDMLNKE